MKTYELTYILPEKFEEKETPKISEKIKTLLPDGKIIQENFWGRKELAYPILKNKAGYYITLIFQTEPENIEKFESRLKLEEDVLRYLIVSAKETKETKKTEETVPKTKPRKQKKPTQPQIKVKPKTKTKTKPKTTQLKKPPKTQITKEIENEEEKMRALDEKLKEILEK